MRRLRAAFYSEAPTTTTSKDAGAGGNGGGDGGAFDFGRLVSAFEGVTFPNMKKDLNLLDASEQGALPYTTPFVRAMGEVAQLFDHLGTAFLFVRRDIESKTSILRGYAAERPELERAVLQEVHDGVADCTAPPSASRTLLRLMWALRFIDELLTVLRTDKSATLRAAVTHAYDAALAEHHTWALRRTVRTATVALPSAETFVQRVGVKPVYLDRLAKTMSPMVSTMYRFYEKHGLLGLP